jgi:hypothetical protein
MRIRAHVAKASNTTIASSIDSLRWCGESMRAGREIVIIQFRAKPFSAAGDNAGNKRLSTSLLTKQESRHAIDLRAHLEPVTQQVPRHNPSAGGQPMIELSAGFLALVSVGIFAAHALDAYRAD